MKHFAVSREHLDFFHEHHFIEFEDLLSSDEVDSLEDAIDETLASRLHIEIDEVPLQNTTSLFKMGFDTWRDNKIIKKTVLQRHFAEIAGQLTKKKLLRIGYDQIFYSPKTMHRNTKDLPNLFQEETSLEQTSCLRGIACGLMLRVSPSAIPLQNTELFIKEDLKAVIPFPQKQGNGIFFQVETPFLLKDFLSIPNQCHLLVVYTSDITLYQLNKKDPHTHLYKRFDYVFGDKLKSTTHPVLYRE